MSVNKLSIVATLIIAVDIFIREHVLMCVRTKIILVMINDADMGCNYKMQLNVHIFRKLDIMPLNNY